MYIFNPHGINPNAFKQDKVWYNANGKAHVIDELPFSYTRNIIQKLHKVGLFEKNKDSPLVKALSKRMQEAKPK